MLAVQPLLAMSAIVGVAAAVAAAPALGDYPHSTTVGPVQHMTLTIGPGSTTMATERVSRQNFAIEPGVPVRLTIANATHRDHTFTIKSLGISVLVDAAIGNAPATRTVTFTTHGYGVLNWNCLLCPDSHHEATTTHMGGKIYSIIAV
jgi:hypothetical protein